MQRRLLLFGTVAGYVSANARIFFHNRINFNPIPLCWVCMQQQQLPLLVRAGKERFLHFCSRSRKQHSWSCCCAWQPWSMDVPGLPTASRHTTKPEVPVPGVPGVLIIKKEVKYESLGAPLFKTESGLSAAPTESIYFSKPPIASPEPPHFAKVLTNIRAMRANRDAPVDRLGCEGNAGI